MKPDLRGVRLTRQKYRRCQAFVSANRYNRREQIILSPHENSAINHARAHPWRRSADAMRRRAIHAASRRDAGEARARLDRGVNPVANTWLASRNLARGRLGPQRRLQLSDRG